jgi:hypothetical protein
MRDFQRDTCVQVRLGWRFDNPTDEINAVFFYFARSKANLNDQRQHYAGHGTFGGNAECAQVSRRARFAKAASARCRRSRRHCDRQ